MKKVMLLLAEGFEELEVVAPLDILRRGGVEVDVVSTEKDLLLKGRNEISLQAEGFLMDYQAEDYDLIFIPGGLGSVQSMKKNPDVQQLLKDWREKDGWVGAICAGPLVMAEADLLTSSTITSHPAAKEELLTKSSNYLEESVVRDGKIVTSRGAGTALEFGLELLEILTDSETVQNIKSQIVYAG